MKTIEQLKEEFLLYGIPPYLSIDETEMLFERIEELEKEVAELKNKEEVK